MASFLFQNALPALAGSFLASCAGTWLASLPARAHFPPGHWTTLARALYPMRWAGGAILATLPIIQAAEFMTRQHSAQSSAWAVFLFSFAGCIMGIRVGSWRAPRAPAAGAASGFPSPSLFLLFHTGTAILVIMLFLNTGRPLGDAALLTASCGFVLLVAWQLGLTVWLLKVTGRLKPLPPDLAALVEEQSARHGIPVRNVFQLDMPMSNAFALPWSGDLAFSARLPKILGTDELKSIISHELGHLREPALYRWGRLLGAFQLTAVGLLPSIVVSFGFKGLAVGFVGYILIGRLGLKLSRMAELAADRTALAGESNGEVYAYALERIHKDNLIPAVMGGNETHPDLCHRMKQAGVTPDYPRLGPPSKSLGVVCMGLAIILAILLNNVFQFLFPLQ